MCWGEAIVRPGRQKGLLTEKGEYEDCPTVPETRKTFPDFYASSTPIIIPDPDRINFFIPQDGCLLPPKAFPPFIFRNVVLEFPEGIRKHADGGNHFIAQVSPAEQS